MSDGKTCEAHGHYRCPEASCAPPAVPDLMGNLQRSLGLPERPAEAQQDDELEVCRACNGAGGTAWDGPCTDCLGEGELPR